MCGFQHRTAPNSAGKPEAGESPPAIKLPRLKACRNCIRACRIQQTLIESVQLHLEQLAQLSRAAKDALTADDEPLAAQIDQRIEDELGLKERAMGLRQHRTEHGC